MPVKVHWLEGESLPAEFSSAGFLRAYRVVSFDGASTDFTDAAEAAKLALALRNEELATLGLPSEDQ